MRIVCIMKLLMQRRVSNFLEAIINIFCFLPYFFSVIPLLKTLLSPWKNISNPQTKQPGFSLQRWADALSFNLISRTMGFLMRSGLLIFYVLLQILLIVLLPFIVVLYTLFFPIEWVMTLFDLPEDKKREKRKEKFIAAHLLNPLNMSAVERWFTQYDARKTAHSRWWTKENLMIIPPLARDWAVGYTPNLDSYCDDLTTPAYQARLQAIVGRQQEIGFIERILSKSNEANVIVVGDEGIGKHTIIDAFSKKIYEGQTNTVLIYKRVLKLHMEKILSTYTDQKQREDFLDTLCSEAVSAKNVIIFIDDMHKYISSISPYVDLSASIEKFAASSQIQFIGVTEPYHYEQIFYQKERLKTIFTKVEVSEVSPNAALQILLDRFDFFETRNQLTLPYETLQCLIEKSNYYITTIPFPEKAMQLLEEACIYTRQVLKKNVVLPEVIDTVLEEKTHITIHLTDAMKHTLINLESLLEKRIIHQHDAIQEIASILRKSFLLREKRRKPFASVLLLGSTGIGKTETAKALAEIFFGTQKDLIRFDMSNYQSKSDIPRLIGSPEHNDPGLLSIALREKPYAVLLLDEIEKADSNLLHIFLSVLDEGYFTDNLGQQIDCKNLIIIATSNAGSNYLYNQPDPDSEQLINTLISERIFAAEFLNRFDGVVLYHKFDAQAMADMQSRILSSLVKELSQVYNITLQLSDGTMQKISAINYNPAFGARDMERRIRKEVEDALSKLILGNVVKKGDTVKI